MHNRLMVNGGDLSELRFTFRAPVQLYTSPMGEFLDSRFNVSNSGQGRFSRFLFADLKRKFGGQFDENEKVSYCSFFLTKKNQKVKKTEGNFAALRCANRG